MQPSEEVNGDSENRGILTGEEMWCIMQEYDEEFLNNWDARPDAERANLLNKYMKPEPNKDFIEAYFKDRDVAEAQALFNMMDREE